MLFKRYKSRKVRDKEVQVEAGGMAVALFEDVAIITTYNVDRHDSKK
jgi:hypothetical protein